MRINFYDPRELAALCKFAAEEARFNSYDDCATRELLVIQTASQHLDADNDRLALTIGEAAYWAIATHACTTRASSWMLSAPEYPDDDAPALELLLNYARHAKAVLEGSTGSPDTHEALETKLNLLQGVLDKTRKSDVVAVLKTFIERTGIPHENTTTQARA